MNRHATILTLLEAIEGEMKQQALWQSQPPSAAALASQQPFCVDTLSFCEWIQWIMVPRLQTLARAEQPLPTSSDIHTMAEEAFKPLEADTNELLTLIRKLDERLRIPH